MKIDCPVCISARIGGMEDDYVQCPECHSYIYVSRRTAEHDNKEFYNEFYDYLSNYRRSRLKRKIFKIFLKKDRKLKVQDYLHQHQMRDSIQHLLQGPGKIVEIGFGEGRMLETLLTNGIDAYGIDISEAVVNEFKKRNPAFQDRVMVGSARGQIADKLYCSALLEHIEDPGSFIRDVSMNLKKDGVIIIDGLPVLCEDDTNITAKCDINFWKPCHRIIYSKQGLTSLFTRYGYVMEKALVVDFYTYRVLSLHLQNNFIEMNRLRNPCMSGRNLPGILKFYMLCREALTSQSKAMVGTFIFRKAE